MEILGYLASVLIGITLGLIGGGGSILTVPILVYLFAIDAENATSYSLFIVGITAMIGAYRHYVLGNLKIKTAFYFALPSIASLLIVRKILLPRIPDLLFNINGFAVTKNLLIMIVFALLMMAASVSMIRKTTEVKTASEHFPQLALIGFLVGFITGFLGAGGGFLIIPALLFFANLPMKQAVGTSLFIIFINSLIGFGGDLLSGIPIDYSLLLTITAIAIIGMLIGTQLSKKIDGAKLKPAFGWFVLLMGIYIIGKEIFLK
ncbi:sulfite exporter TauE/SafE family protein [Flavobacterium sp. CYK-4]|uniref:sulfite exporter TauE/SafE family protein n=1 Tax=Flavobacterium lotistagni TaxID=2709660 RepID=UPI00140AB8A4|nr:sulfite exporter TauE/SafE family protein [Flavobacterium lotistagni]NHM07385.1 sulfite exporter TauE/SafE family protein [Flavobacterium lotistagni]